MNRIQKKKILIVDDSLLNRELLSDMLSEEYDILEAKNGEEAIAIISERFEELALVLLDIMMPVLDGFAVLAYMNDKHQIEELPVIIISSETSPEAISRTYELGAADYVSRPFNTQIVRRRVSNIIITYAKQKRLANIIADRIYENERNKNLMVAILSHIVEFRNGESALHVMNITVLAKLFTEKLITKTSKYNIDRDMLNAISNASALHDIGKISIPDEIINKPGALTDSEYAIMKTHSEIGANMLRDLPVSQDDILVRTAYEICRWHHERYDGHGYPDGLVGDEIPISAQIAALADVYDALTHKRCYKHSYTHEEAVKMILNGECGAFNPLLMEVLAELSDTLPEKMAISSIQEKAISETMYYELLRYDELFSSMQRMQNVQTEHLKYQFLLAQMEDPVLSFNYDLSLVSLSKNAAKLGLPEVFANPDKHEKFTEIFGKDIIDRIRAAIAVLDPRNNTFDFDIECNINGKTVPYVMKATAIFKARNNGFKIASVLARLIKKES